MPKTTTASSSHTVGEGPTGGFQPGPAPTGIGHLWHGLGLLWEPRIRHVGTKLILVLVVSLGITVVALEYLNISVHRRHLQQSAISAAANLSDVIKRSTTYYMFHNDREGLHQMMNTIAGEPGVVRIRIINPQGRVSYSSDPQELGIVLSNRSPECIACHVNGSAAPLLPNSGRFRVFQEKNQRVLGIITAIENKPECSNAECHAHPAKQRVLGIMDTHVSLARADESIAETNRTLASFAIVGLVLVTVIVWIAVRQVVHKPIAQLRAGTERLANGELGFHIHVSSHDDEVGLLADSFNSMSSQLLEARREITLWTHTLEQRVQSKTAELRRAHDQMLRAERMVAIGKMAAVVAHEINNPLAGILTYAKLLHKWVDRGITTEDKKQEACQCLDLIASESQRCGALVKNLLTFSRTSPMNLEKADINNILDRSVRLVQHRAELGSVNLIVDMAKDLPFVHCDISQIEQVLLALIINALDAMPRGGNLWLSSRLVGSEIELVVRDDGVGIPPDVLPKIFEPFTTTKEVGKGVGLGLAIAKGIVERHGGRIELQSELGVGTTFRVFMPLESKMVESAPATLAGVE